MGTVFTFNSNSRAAPVPLRMYWLGGTSDATLAVLAKVKTVPGALSDYRELRALTVET